MNKTFLAAALMACATTLTPASAQTEQDNHDLHLSHGNHANHSNAPIGVMGDHLMAKGEWMVSLSHMHMEMNGNRNGTDNLSPSDVITFTNPNGPPGLLRVAPTEMSMDMTMLGAMYGVNNWLTVMAMATYIQKEMNHLTFNGGGTQIGGFTTRSEGIGDTSLTALIGLYRDNIHNLHLNAGLSLPTGSITETDDVLAPTGATPTLRLPYAMQIGSGTFDFLPGITYTGQKSRWGWGTQYRANIRLEDENSEGYSLGDQHNLTAWGGYQFNQWFQGNTRLTANYGGRRVEASMGFNITPQAIQAIDVRGLEIGGEVTVPLYQDLNGPQLERDVSAILGVSYRF